MITSFFKTSKPVNYFLVIALIVFQFTLHRTTLNNSGHNSSTILETIGILAVFLCSFFISVFVITKNKLTQNNTYGVLFFLLIMSLVPQVILENSLIYANFFVLLALRRIFSLKTQHNIKKKLFDATLWICVAAVFEPWVILYFIVVIGAILLFTLFNTKNILVLPMSIITFVVVTTIFSLFVTSSFPLSLELIPTVNWEEPYHQKIGLNVGVLAFITFMAILFLFKRINQRTKADRSSQIVLMLTLIIGIAICILTLDHDFSGVIFMMTPWAIIIANYAEEGENKLVSEILIWLILVMSIFNGFGYLA